MSNTSSDGARVEHKALRALAIGKHNGNLATRIGSVAVISVVVAVGIAIGVAYPLVKAASDDQARETLSRQADFVVDLLEDGRTDRPEPPRQGRNNGIGRDVLVVAVTSTTSPVDPITIEDISLVTSGISFSATRTTPSGSYFIEGRPIGDGEGVILIQPNSVTQGPANQLIVRMGIGLAAGLVLAIVLAIFVARRTARPLKNAVKAAEQLAAGNREVDVVVEGAQEIADLARSLNVLAANLAMSEDRQREFLMSVSHELRTPMTSIKGYAEALADGVIETNEMQSTGVLLSGEAARLERLVADLLDLARAGSVDFRLAMTKADIGAIAKDAADAWSLKAQRDGINFSADITSTALLSYVDPTRVRQIIDNLVENAFRITPEGGKIILSAHIVDSQVSLVIEDSGPGLSDEDIEVAFQPAVLHSRYRGIRPVGTGLGLALVGRLATRMNGTATAAHSSLGGAKFRVDFPQVSS